MTAQQKPPAGKYRLTLDDFLRLDETGVFGTDRTELLDGDIIIMNAEYRPHARIVSEFLFRLRVALEAVESDLAVMGGSIALSEHDMPLPDVVLTREPDGEGPIPSASVALIVEVSSSTLDRDMRDKQAIYARAGIPEYWVVDVGGRVIHLMWTPGEPGYADRQEIAFGERIVAATIEGLAMDTSPLV